jgi:ribosomal protein L2
VKRYVSGALLPMLGVLAAIALASSCTSAETNASPSKPESWLTVRDVREQAFSIAVPKKWKTYGGLFRFSSVDARLLVDMTSPDGNTNIRVGDSTVPPYTVPGLFIRPGPHMAAYASGNVFATKYGQARFASMCQRLQVTRSQAIAPKYHPPGGGLIRTTGGEAYFTCTRNGAAMSAYVYAETTLVGPGGPGSNWTVVALGSMIAPAEQASAAAAILRYSGESLAINPAWMQMQTRLNDQAIRQINASTQATIAATNAADAHQRAMISALQNDSFNDVINGVSLKVDPSTGQRYEAPLGTGNSQWVNGNKVVVESAMSPGPGFTQLQTVSR